MSASDGLAIALSVVTLVAAVRFGLIVPLWNAIKGVLVWAILPDPKRKRTANQIRFDTDMKWHDVRWSIARIEHELYPEGGWAWTHEAKDCVDPECNPEFLRVMIDKEGKEYVRKMPFTSPERVPILKQPPPPPPRHGGRPAPNPVQGSPEKH